MTKEEARKIFRQKREALPHAARQEMNEQIARQFFSNFLLRDIHVLHSYLPIEKKGEVNTWLIIEKAQTLPRPVRISVPKAVGENLEHYYFENKNQLKENRWGILEPQEGEKTPAEKIDLVIAPLLAFDKNLNRAGYGKGYYDKFLKTCRKDCLFVGLSYFPPIDKIDNLHDGDFALHRVVTPQKVY